MPNIGKENNVSQETIQSFNKRQIYSKGFSFQTQANTTNNFPIQLNGNARRLYGITLFFPVADINAEDIISLSINEENVITETIWWNYSTQSPNGNQFKREAYFPLSRSLSGTDTIALSVKSTGAHKLYPVFWMSNSVEPE